MPFHPLANYGNQPNIALRPSWEYSTPPCYCVTLNSGEPPKKMRRSLIYYTGNVFGEFWKFTGRQDIRPSTIWTNNNNNPTFKSNPGETLEIDRPCSPKGQQIKYQNNDSLTLYLARILTSYVQIVIILNTLVNNFIQKENTEKMILIPTRVFVTLMSCWVIILLKS